MATQIFDGQAADGNSAEFEHGRKSQHGTRGTATGTLFITGTIGGAVLRIQGKAPDGSWQNSEDGLITEAGQYPIAAPYFVGRINMANSGGSTNVNAWYEAG